MRRPRPRRGVVPRKSDNDKRRLWQNPPEDLIERLLREVRYRASAKHKRNPQLYDLPPFIGHRGDATLCDEHAGFQPDRVDGIPELIARGIRAGLIGDTGRIIWTVADDGWIYEGRETNAATHEFHGYPVRQNEAIAEPVCLRFADWAIGESDLERGAATSCRNRYGVR